jgi:hypothetical protein
MPPLQPEDLLETVKDVVNYDIDLLFWVPEGFAQSVLYFTVLCWFLVVVYYRIFPYRQPHTRRRGILRNVFVDQR